MVLASEVRAAVSAVNETDRRLARLVGQHITDAAQGLQELRGALEAKELAPANFRSLPPASAAELASLKVPELRGLSLRKAIFTLNKSKLKFNADGSGKVIWQSPEPGRLVSKGSTISMGLN